ncbi:MAG: ABC transporter ATP-binding protein [Clostridia bacterium]|nr:ABC transporter ATP-binding protein [Clostridia bacterium]
MSNKVQKKDKKSLLTYLAKHKLGITLFILCYTLGGVCSILTTICFANAITEITIDDFSKAMIIMAVIVGLTLLMRMCFWLSNFIYNKFSTKITAELNQDLAKQAFKLNSNTFNSHGTGTFVQRIVSDPEMVISNLQGIIEVLTDALIACVMVIYIGVLNIYVTLGLLVIIVAGLILEICRIKVRRKNRKEVKKYNDKINSLTTEIVKSEKDVKSLALDEKLSDVSKENYNNYRKKSYKFSQVDTNFYTARNIIIDVGMVLVLLLGVILMDKAMLTLAAFMIIYSSRYSLYDVVWGFGYIGNSLVEVKVGCERMFALFDEDEFVVEKFGNKTVENVKGKIEFKKVGYVFREYEYEKNENNKSKQKPIKKLKSENKIFKDLSFTIQPNTTVAFVGKSGSGKSTILNLISKMYEAENGKILIDGVDIKEFSKESLRNAISLVNQFPYIFDMTIKENMLLAKGNATDIEIEDAITRASLKQFVDGLPEGINTKVGESGIKLSGGQRQRLAIARAMLRNSPITIFDESTSSLDNYAQGDIKKSIDDMKGKSTIIIVAHRLSTIRNVDKIFFLDKGKIVDEGTFDELFETNESFNAMFLAEGV